MKFKLTVTNIWNVSNYTEIVIQKQKFPVPIVIINGPDEWPRASIHYHATVSFQSCFNLLIPKLIYRWSVNSKQIQSSTDLVLNRSFLKVCYLSINFYEREEN